MKKGEFDEMVVKELSSDVAKQREFYVVDNITIVDDVCGRTSDSDLMIEETVESTEIVPQKKHRERRLISTEIKSRCEKTGIFSSLGSGDGHSQM